MREILSRLRDIRLVRYILASVGALAFDMGSFLLLLTMGVASTVAAACGYSLGILVHWLLSSRTVFHDSVADRGAARSKQKALFVVSALIGLGLTTLIVGGGDYAGLDPRIAKVGAIAVSFAVTYMLRKVIVFSPAARP